MNQIPATIKQIESYEGITIVDFTAEGEPMKMMALEIDESLKAGSEVILGIKSSNIALAKAPAGVISISNRLDATVEEIDRGKLLCTVRFRLGPHLLESLITAESSERIGLQKGDRILALIKSSELSILEKR